MANSNKQRLNERELSRKLVDEVRAGEGWYRKPSIKEMLNEEKSPINENDRSDVLDAILATKEALKKLSIEADDIEFTASMSGIYNRQYGSAMLDIQKAIQLIQKKLEVVHRAV